MTVQSLVAYIQEHRCLSHPIFNHWAEAKPNPEKVAALFHQIRSFCDATRPVHNLAEGLMSHGFSKESGLVKQIGGSEENHGPELATMAGHILNKMNPAPMFADVYSQDVVEAHLKACSDALLSHYPGYDTETGLLTQNHQARNVFEGRKYTDEHYVLKNLGTTLALEMTSNRHLIPGEKLCLVDSKLYDVNLDEKEMHYLAEHWGETGAEAMHEQAALDAIQSVMRDENKEIVFQGARDFLDSLAALWDILDEQLLKTSISPEQLILSLWKKYTLLPFDSTVDFFESGGDSLSAIHMIVEIQKTYKVDISLENFMRTPTIQFLLGAVDALEAA